MATLLLLLLKLATIIVGLIVTTVGRSAHLNSAAIELFNQPDFYNNCTVQFKDCPIHSIGMEQFFVAITISCLCLSVGNLIFSFGEAILPGRLRLIEDFGYHFLSCFLSIIAGALMIISALDLDAFTEALYTYKKYDFDWAPSPNIARNELQYDCKIVAGVLAMYNGVLYFATATAVAVTIFHK